MAAEKNIKNEEPELFEVYIPRNKNNKDGLFVGINGRTVQVKTGEKVKVDKAVYEVIMNMQRMDALAEDRREKLIEQSK